MSEFTTFRGKNLVKRIGENEYRVDKMESIGMNIPVTIYANENLISKMINDRTIDQAVNVSTLPGVVKHVIVLPDGHEGYGFPVGGVAAMDMESGVISPGGVGYDINCGVRLLNVSLSEDKIRLKLKDLVNELFKSIPAGVGSSRQSKLRGDDFEEILVKGAEWAVNKGYGFNSDVETCEENGSIDGADPTCVSDIARKRGIPQLGTLGSGNHFLEIQRIDEIFNEEAAKKMGLRLGQTSVLIHCGSRGFGHQVCSDYLRISESALRKSGLSIVDRELACVPNVSKEGEEYRKAMYCALNFAWSNRQMITHYTRKAFQRVFDTNESELDMNLVYDVAHNIAKVERHRVDGEGSRDLIIHRKGATRAFPQGNDNIPSKYKSIGQPVIIPGSMGTASWVLLGNSKSLDLSFGSTAHGAGRTMSRSAARRSYTVDGVRKALESKGVVVKSLSKEGVVEETPQAYKDVDEVVEISHRLGIATKVARLVPIGVIKG
jgi:tRNA-splicing ligase RtcB